ncbi:MAG: electron transporter RnfB [Desulfobacteraceae bacterium 4572_130]|nr:MAG: electron transporter RnfB [Desulfobacteraceae bacterium 4572_130]
MLKSVFLMGGLGFVIGGILAFASKIFYVYVDPKIVAIEDVLPGANCGGCGFPGCTPNAEAIVQGKASADSCVAAGPDVAIAIAELMGVSLEEKEPEFALSSCYYSKQDADIKYLYDGIKDCRAASIMSGGMKVCNIGCLGLGTCVTACLFGALSMGENGLPKVNEEKCTGCGACEKICPKNIIKLTSITRRIIREYTEDECVTPCQRACPTGIDIRKYINLIKNGDNKGALQVIKERNPFPSVIGRICPAFCEVECRRQLVDEPVAINHLKRFVSDIEIKLGKRVFPYKAPDTGKKIAVLGGGVEGLSAAFFTARLGHEPTVFETTSILGGLLRFAISEYRLPQHILDWDIQGIIEMGVKVKTDVKVGKDMSLSSFFKSGFDAVFTATGGWDNRLVRDEISDIVNIFPGGYLLIDVLRNNIKNEKNISWGKNVVIAGDDIIISDAIKICMEFGTESITIISRKTKGNSCFNNSQFTVNNKTKIIYNAGITKICGKEDNLTNIECTDLTTGNISVVNADTLVVTSGRFPEFIFTKTKISDNEASELDLDSIPLKWEGVEIHKDPANIQELGLLSNSDMISGYSAAVKAINGGRKAAATIHNLIYGISLEHPLNFITKYSYLQKVDCLKNVKVSPRNIMPVFNDIKAEPQHEFLQGFTSEMAQKESERCLKCGLICYEQSQHSSAA